MSNLVGQILGRYHLIQPLGEGGMAIVYKALDTQLECEVAVKVIRTENIIPKTLEHTLKRFIREGHVLQRMDHPNIVRILDSGETDKIPWLVMPLISGGTLKKYMKKRGKLPFQEAMEILIPVANALSYAHNLNIIHRDIKPSNILLTKEKTPMLTDFGIAKILEDEATMDLTGTSATVGTPEYMAPEQISSKAVDARADIYSLGVILYEMITGRRPFEADTPMAVIVKHASEPLPRPSMYLDDLPASVENVLIKALAKNPDNRYASMDAFIAAMQAVMENPQIIPTEIHPETDDLLTTDSDLVHGTFATNIFPPQIPPVPSQTPFDYSNPFPTSPAGKKNWLYWIIGGVVVFIGVLFIILTQYYKEQPASPPRIDNPSTSTRATATATVTAAAASLKTDEPAQATATRTPQPENTPTSQVVVMSTATSTLNRECGVYTYLHPGDLTFVSLGGGRNSIRSDADTTPSDNKIGIAESGEMLLIVDGPVCDHGDYLLWQVEPTIYTDWASGWTPEVAQSDGEYWLSPVPQWNPCGDSRVSHLQKGEDAYLSIINDTSNRIRQTADVNGSDIGRITPGESFSILDGPVCANSAVWWKVQTSSNVIGWTVEGMNNEFWIIPIIH